MYASCSECHVNTNRKIKPIQSKTFADLGISKSIYLFRNVKFFGSWNWFSCC